MNQILYFRDQRVSEEEVGALIDVKRADLRYFCCGAKAVPVDWAKEIDGARVLKEIFSELSDTREAYVKTKHSVAITEDLLKRDPQKLKEIADLLTDLLSG